MDPRPSSEDAERTEATDLLLRMRGGDREAAGQLLPLVYEQLRGLAAGYFRRQPQGHTLQPTALVHEAFLKMVRNPDADWKSRGHFLAVAATAMRQILTDHARTKARAKHGGDLEQEPISQIASPSGNQSLDLLVLERALSKLAEADARQARIIELWFFAGMTMEEIAEILEISDRTVRRDWRHARAWLNSEMASSEKK